MAYGNPKQAYERLMDTMFASMGKENRAAIEQHVAWLKAKGSNPRTVLKHLYHLQRFIVKLDKGVILDNITREEVERAMARVEETDYSLEVKNQIKIVLKLFYKHRQGEDERYPRAVSWIKTSNKTRKILPEDILSEAEVLKMIKNARCERDRAIIALLFDTGIRIGELLSLRVKDVTFGNEISHITVNGKTGMRQIPVIFSVPYLARYADTVEVSSSSEPFWQTRNKSGSDRLDYPAARKMIKDVTKRAKINKRIYPHLFRHSRASFYANKVTEQQLKAYFGWSGSSRMAATYVHLSGRDIDNAILGANGLKPKDEQTEPILKVKPCQRCQERNPVDATYCVRCGGPLDIKTAIEVQAREERTKQEIAEALKDPKAIEEIVHAYLMMQAKKGKKL
jgi:site-specific recombinase XerD/ribosomal protein L40E